MSASVCVSAFLLHMFKDARPSLIALFLTRRVTHSPLKSPLLMASVACRCLALTAEEAAGRSEHKSCFTLVLVCAVVQLHILSNPMYPCLTNQVSNCIYQPQFVRGYISCPGRSDYQWRSVLLLWLHGSYVHVMGIEFPRMRLVLLLALLMCLGARQCL